MDYSSLNPPLPLQMGGMGGGFFKKLNNWVVQKNSVLMGV